MTDSFRSYANSFQAVSRLGLERISALCRELGNPERRLRCLHIAGTNGKGSVAAYLSAILSRAGYRTGLYTSPNLVRVNERIRIDGEPIGDGELTELLARVEKASRAVEAEAGEMPTQFEIWTAAAFLYFAEQATDYVVLETGLGGEFDATNVIPHNVMSILTRIDLDHTGYLGDTVGAIAETKSRIIKADSETHLVISAPQMPEAASAILAEAAAKGSEVVFVDPPAPCDFEEICERFICEGLPLAPSLGGTCQIENAAVAAVAARRLGIPDPAILDGIAAARHPARLEILSREPYILYDGGHNPNGIAALNASLDRYFPGREMTVILASMKDKDIAPSLRLLAKAGRSFLFTEVQSNPRAMSANELCRRAGELGIVGEAVPTLAEAIGRARELGRMILICGSLYLYADLPQQLRGI